MSDEDLYFPMQAEIGVTKHAGGANATDKLIRLCKINKNSNVLVVGSGTGASCDYIKKQTACNLTGIDLSKAMVESAKKKYPNIKFKVENAEKLSFKNNTFDAIISESVTAFTDKTKSIKEYGRVLKKGGYLGLNESTWITPPTEEIKLLAKRSLRGVMPENKETWEKLIKDFEIITSETHILRIRDSFSEARLNGIKVYFTAIPKFFKLYLNKRYRRYINGLLKDSIKLFKLSKAFGYGIYVGKK
ncbi:class I SAM-dependent methyltransferase [candidate division KSB1 bacterium]